MCECKCKNHEEEEKVIKQTLEAVGQILTQKKGLVLALDPEKEKMIMCGLEMDREEVLLAIKQLVEEI